MCVSSGRWANKDKDRGGNGRNGGQPPTLQSVSIGLCETFPGFLSNYKENILGFCNPSRSLSKPQSPPHTAIQSVAHLPLPPMRPDLPSCWRQSELEQGERSGSPRGAGGLIMLFLTALRGSISVPVRADHHIYNAGPLHKQPGHQTHTPTAYLQK